MKSMFAAGVAAALLISLSAPAPAHAAGEVTFAYQGRVRVQGQPFHGTGQFKFAIVNTSGTATLWSNDQTSVNGEEPAGAVMLPVEAGIFNAIIGDPTAGMNLINGTIFNSQNPLKLRVWINDGQTGFEKLNPDHSLVNLTLNVLETGDSDFTIYVNGATGDDTNNGLSPSTAKKTIQGGIDSLPVRIRCNVTIDIAPGTYREEVNLYGLSLARTKTLTLTGDEAWTPASAGTPDTVSSGADAGSPTRIRNYAVYATQCTGVVLKGLHFTNAIQDGALFQNGLYKVENRLATGNGTSGITISKQSEANLTNCHAGQNGIAGYWVATASRSTMTSCSATLNNYGLRVFSQSQVQLVTKGEFSRNGTVASPGGGIQSAVFSDVGFSFPFSGGVRNNIGFGFDVGWHAYVIYTSQAVVSGNTSGNNTFYGGIIYP